MFQIVIKGLLREWAFALIGQRCAAVPTHSTADALDSVVHDAGQTMFATRTSIEVAARDFAGRARLVAVTALWFETETVTHQGLPLRSVRTRLAPSRPVAPEHMEVRDFMRDGLGQVIVLIAVKKVAIDPDLKSVRQEPGLTGTATAQRVVDVDRRQTDSGMSGKPGDGLVDRLSQQTTLVIGHWTGSTGTLNTKSAGTQIALHCWALPARTHGKPGWMIGPQRVSGMHADPLSMSSRIQPTA